MKNVYTECEHTCLIWRFARFSNEIFHELRELENVTYMWKFISG